MKNSPHRNQREVERKRRKKPLKITKKNQKTMANLTKEELAQMDELLKKMGASENTKKVLKSDRGLIERTKSSKVILTEDNRQILND